MMGGGVPEAFFASAALSVSFSDGAIQIIEAGAQVFQILPTELRYSAREIFNRRNPVAVVPS